MEVCEDIGEVQKWKKYKSEVMAYLAGRNIIIISSIVIILIIVMFITAWRHFCLVGYWMDCG